MAAPAAAEPVIRAGLLCNDARLRLRDDQWTVDGDPMEGALVALAMKYGLDADRVRGEWQRRDEIPFDAAYRFMATLGVAADGEAWIFVKGAPERLMAMSAADRKSVVLGKSVSGRVDLGGGRNIKTKKDTK